MKITDSQRIDDLCKRNSSLQRQLHEIRNHLGMSDITDEPKLKQLDQSVFNGLDEKWRFAAVNADGFVGLFKDQPYVIKKEWAASYTLHQNLGDNFDTTDWQNSLIERDKVELTGSDLCRKMLEKQQVVIPCWVNHISDEYAVKNKHLVFIRTMNGSRFAEQDGSTWPYAVPLMVEPLTQSDLGL